jgi:endoglucanase
MSLSSTTLFRFTLLTTLTALSGGCLTDNPPPRHAPLDSGAPKAPGYTPAPEPVVQKTCAGKTRRAADGLIDDLEDGNHQAAAQGGRDGYWFTTKADHAAIKVPAGNFMPFAGGPPGSKQTVQFVGKTAYEDNWGAAVGLGFLASGAFYDASKYAGIGFRIKAGKPNFNVRVKLPDGASHPDGGLCKTQCWNAFGKELILSTEWQDVTLTWSELTQQSDWGEPRPPSIDPKKLKNVEWAVYPGVEFDLTIDDVHFLECE